MRASNVLLFALMLTMCYAGSASSAGDPSKINSLDGNTAHGSTPDTPTSPHDSIIPNDQGKPINVAPEVPNDQGKPINVAPDVPNDQGKFKWQYKGDPPNINSLDDALKAEPSPLARYLIFESGKSNPSKTFRQIVSDRKAMNRVNSYHLNIAFNEMTDYVDRVKEFNRFASVNNGKPYKAPQQLVKNLNNIHRNLLTSKRMKHIGVALEKKSIQISYDMTRGKALDGMPKQLKAIRNPMSSGRYAAIGGLVAAGAVGGLAYMNSGSSSSDTSSPPEVIPAVDIPDISTAQDVQSSESVASE